MFTSAHQRTFLLHHPTASLQVLITWFFFVSPLPPFPFTPNWASHNCGIGPDCIDLRLFYLTHLLAGLLTHHWMLNSIKGNATVIKGLVSQLLLAHAPHALNCNRWRTSGARLNTHSESPKARWQAEFFFFFIYFHSAWARATGILCQSVYWSWARSLQSPCLSLTLSTHELTQALQFFIMWNVDVMEKFCHSGPDCGAEKPHCESSSE